MTFYVLKQKQLVDNYSTIGSKYPYTTPPPPPPFGHTPIQDVDTDTP